MKHEKQIDTEMGSKILLIQQLAFYIIVMLTLGICIFPGLPCEQHRHLPEFSSGRCQRHRSLQPSR